jgi:hypothetical protein
MNWKVPRFFDLNRVLTWLNFTRMSAGTATQLSFDGLCQALERAKIIDMQSKPTTRDMLLAKEGLASLIALAILVLAAAFYQLEPVGSEYNTGHARAPWLFLGLQELLHHMPALLAGIVIPMAALLLYAALPWLPKSTSTIKPRWQRRWLTWEYPAWLALLAWCGLTAFAALFR